MAEDAVPGVVEVAGVVEVEEGADDSDIQLLNNALQIPSTYKLFHLCENDYYTANFIRTYLYESVLLM